MSSELVIVAEGLSKAYHVFDKPQDRFLQMLVRGKKHYFSEFQALRDVSFEICRGETVGIIGRNGSGKSTLLQIICGTLQQTGGNVSVNGRIAALLELGAGFNPEFSGRENVLLYASVLGLEEELVAERFDSMVEFADIGEFLDQPVKTYSSGMVVRLAFAVIAHVDADILIIDEALAVGDAYFVQKCIRFLRGFRENGTLLFVSHDMSSVLALCDRAIWLDKGEVRTIDKAKTAVGQYLQGLFNTDGLSDGEASADNPLDNEKTVVEYRDQRNDFINASNLRNDIEVFEFDHEAADFSQGKAEVVEVEFLEDGKRLTWIVGGENVNLRIQCVSAIHLDRPIIGFLIKNRLGQSVFGDNTYLTYCDDPVPVTAGSVCEARFEFTMPRLPVGEYTMDVSISNGEQKNHQMLNWKYDVLAFQVHSSSTVHGMVAVPMKNISLEAIDGE